MSTTVGCALSLQRGLAVWGSTNLFGCHHDLGRLHGGLLPRVGLLEEGPQVRPHRLLPGRVCTATRGKTSLLSPMPQPLHLTSYCAFSPRPQLARSHPLYGIFRHACDGLVQHSLRKPCTSQWCMEKPITPVHAECLAIRTNMGAQQGRRAQVQPCAQCPCSGPSKGRSRGGVNWVAHS